MTRLMWDEQNYDVGVEKVVFYSSATGLGVAWSGITTITENPDDTNDVARYVDGVKRQRYRRGEDFSGTIEAYTYPDAFYEDILTQRRPRSFGLTYQVRTKDSYKIHLVYNASISPSQFAYERSDEDTFSWDFTTTPIYIPGARATAHLIIDPSIAYTWTMQAFEDILYGSEAQASRLPQPLEVLSIFEENSIVRVVDHGDGTFTVSGPDDIVQMIDATTFKIDWPSAVYIDADTYTIHSL